MAQGEILVTAEASAGEPLVLLAHLVNLGEIYGVIQQLHAQS
jgi:hypothetical protein